VEEDESASEPCLGRHARPKAAKAEKPMTFAMGSSTRPLRICNYSNVISSAAGRSIIFLSP